MQEFKKTILLACVTYGVSQIPSQEEVMLLYNAVQSCYPHHTIEEVNHALFLNATGQNWERVACYNLISVPFLCDCMNKYVEWSRKMVLDIKKKEHVEIRPSHLLENASKIDWVEWLKRDKASQHKDVATALARLVISKLYNLQVLTDADFTDEEWQAFEKKAMQNYKVAKRTTGKASKKTEFMICVYAHILSTDKLFNTIIERLNQQSNE